jgi:MIP family channel proteins
MASIELSDFKGTGPAELHHHSKIEISDSKDWVKVLRTWLPGLDEGVYNSYAQKFVENHIYDVDTLAKIESSELKDLKITTGHRAIILDNARRNAKRSPATFHSVCGDLGWKVHGMYDELTSLKLWQGVVGEFLASGVFVFILNSIIVSSGLLVQKGSSADDSLFLTNLPGDRYLSISVGAGFAFAVAVYTFSPIGAGHVTPAITLAYLFTSAITPLRWALYLCAQLIGAMIATGFAETLSPAHFDQAQGGRNIPQPGYDAGSSLGIEVLTTLILVLTALSYTDRKRSRGSAEFGPAALGFVVLCVHLIALPINGASMNPARSFASSALYHAWDNQWTYWLGPALGSLIAVVWYELFLRDKSCAVHKVGRE